MTELEDAAGGHVEAGGLAARRHARRSKVDVLLREIRRRIRGEYHVKRAA
jgi:hypothetical protein